MPIFPDFLKTGSALMESIRSVLRSARNNLKILPRQTTRILLDACKEIEETVVGASEELRVITVDVWRDLKQRAVKHKDSLITATAIGSMVFTGANAFLLRQQIELENRPFVSIKNVWWQHQPGDWLRSGFTLQNYGAKPAEEFSFKNFRAVVFDMNQELLVKKVRATTLPASQETLDMYIRDERNRLILHLMGMLASYFRENPDVNKKQLEEFLNGLKPDSPELKGEKIFTYEGKLLFRVVEINNEMDEYRRRQRFVVVPNEPRGEILAQQMGDGSLQSILQGDNLLIIFWAFEYQGPQKLKQYSIHYLGYSDKFFATPVPLTDGTHGVLTQEFQSWLF